MKKITAAVIMIFAVMTFSATITWSGRTLIDTDVTISSTDVLIIEAGSTVRFAYGVRLIVYGEIISSGTESEPVQLIPENPESNWGGVEINSLTGNNEFNYTIFRNIDVPWSTGRGGLTITGSTATVSNCEFYSNYSETGGAVKIVSGSVTVSGSYFNKNGAQDGGAVYILNDSDYASAVNIIGCKFEFNEAWNNGGAIFIQDTETSQNMILNIVKCDISNHDYSYLGGGIYYSNMGKIELELSKTKIFNNSSQYGSAVYIKFNDINPTAILPQIFANLLIFKNRGYYQSGIYFDMGQVQNPANINFTNATVADNSISAYKEKQDNTSGIYIKSSGNAPQIRNTILWENTNAVGESNFFIEDGSGPSPYTVFRYCDISAFDGGDTIINSDPGFERPPLTADISVFDTDRFDYHLSLESPCANAGDPLEPCTELNSTRVDMGAYGNTIEAVRAYTTELPPAANTDIIVPAGYAKIIDFEGKAVKADYGELILNSNSEIYFKAAYNADISFTKLTNFSKFDGGYVKIHTHTKPELVQGVDTPPQSITFEESIDLVNADLNDIKLVFNKNAAIAEVNLNNTKFFTKDGTMECGLEIIEADMINVENSKFLGFSNGGLRVGSDLQTKTKASGRISNNTVSFDASESNKNKAGKRVGIEINNAYNMIVEDNEIEGGDEGIVVKSSSGGRISNNTVSFDASESNKGQIKKAISISLSSTPAEISGNIITSYDDASITDVIGIEVDGSKADIIGNKMYYCYYDGGTDTRIGINIINPLDTLRIINNTILNPFLGIRNTYGAMPVPIILANNVYWTDYTFLNYETIYDSTGVTFLNNCFIDSTKITGSGNIFEDPEIYNAWDEDFSLASTSPCINAGIVIDGIHSFLSSKTVYYYGSAPDIGAVEYWQDSQPVSVETSVSGTDFTFSWASVDGFTNYAIYASDDPYGTFTKLEIVSGLSYTASISSAKKFYYVTATTDPVGKYSEIIAEPDVTSSVSEPSVENTGTAAKKVRIHRQSNR